MIADALQLAKQATNGWACYAKRDVEHREIARLHEAIRVLESEALTTLQGVQELPLDVDVHLLAWAVSNCHTLARRRIRALEKFDGAVVNDEREAWGHVLRICEKAGARSQGVLKASVPTEITNGEELLSKLDEAAARADAAFNAVLTGVGPEIVTMPRIGVLAAPKSVAARAPQEPPASQLTKGQVIMLRSIIKEANANGFLADRAYYELDIPLAKLEAQEARPAPPLDWHPPAKAEK